jgi:hypothetical protein
MKKFSIVLLALLLAGGFAFAAELTVDGSATSSFGLNFDEEEYGFGLAESSTFDLTWTGEGSSEGEGDVYGVISITDAELTIDELGAVAGTPGDLSAKIVGPDWEVAFGSSTGFGNAEAPDMAQDGDDTASYDAVTPTFESGNGLTVTYSGLTAGFDFFYDNDANDDGVMNDDDLVYMVTTGYSADLAEGLTADAEVAIASLSGSASTDFFGTVALTYAMDEMTVDAAFDMVFDGSFAYDASVATSYTLEGVTLDLAGYFDGTFDAFAKASYEQDALTAAVWAYVSDNGSAARGDAADAWEVGVDLAYDIDDVYSAYANASYTASANVPLTVGLDAAVIDNASVNLEYATADAANFANNKGSLTASVTVEL